MIRGIENQMMITRQTDFVKDASTAQKQPEINQEHLAAQQKIESTTDQSRVAAMLESENENIRTDVDKEGSGTYEGDSSKRDDEMTEEQKKELLVAPALHDQLIDIMI